MAKHDESVFSQSLTLSNNLRSALVVRIGEKRILTSCASKYKATLEEAKSSISSRGEGQPESGRAGKDQKKRKRPKGDADEEKVRKRFGR